MEIKKAKYDLVVCGGGIPGICAAITAARNGVKVALTELRPILGGNSSSLALVPPHGAASFWHNRMAREGGILEEIMIEYACRSPLADNRRIWDLILQEWCVREPNLDLYMNTRVDGVETRDNRIESVQVTQHSTETVYHLSAPLFVDGTGDAYVADAAGAEFRRGREGREEFGEDLAPEIGDSKTLPCALYLIAHRRDQPMPYKAPDWVTKHVECGAFPHRPHVVDKFAKGKRLNEEGSAIQLFWWCSLGGEKDIIKESETIQAELESEAFGVWDHLKNHCTEETRKSLECYEAVWWSPFPLRRESRRVIGDYMLTGSDIFDSKLFEDRVSYGGWPVDVHPPEGLRSKDPPCDQTFVNELYSVPFRIMYSRNIDNLMLVGRSISVSHVAMGSIRVMNSLGAAAQAVGMAAALCKEHGVSPREVGKNHMTELQQGLLKEDVYIISLPNKDPKDQALNARISSSSQMKLEAGKPDGFLELAYDLAQQLPVSNGRVEKVSVLLKSERTESCTVDISIFESRKLARFDNKEPVVNAEVLIEPGEEKWVEVELNCEVPEDILLWITIGKQLGVSWGYSDKEAFGSRFAVRFHGELKPKPSHGLARIAPLKDDWIAINHNGRLPEELHKWIEATVGLKYDRKVRATFCCKVTPDSTPYEGRNVTNGISRAEDWPNIWISDPSETFPQDITLTWDSAATISEVMLTFDTDLCAPDRCFGWPREEFRFVFPVPECVKDYRILCRKGAGWKELIRVEGNYHRKRTHRLETPVKSEELRIEVLSTHGADTARIYEIRVY
jgi:hypothetical protein